jgi:hypothetical protein
MPANGIVSAVRITSADGIANPLVLNQNGLEIMENLSEHFDSRMDHTPKGIPPIYKLAGRSGSMTGRMAGGLGGGKTGAYHLVWKQRIHRSTFDGRCSKGKEWCRAKASIAPKLHAIALCHQPYNLVGGI